jgi:hypothetical protein
VLQLDVEVALSGGVAMATCEQTQQQRLRHIIECYDLAGDREMEGDRFQTSLDRLSQTYPLVLVELAFVEVLAQHWLRLPRPQGVRFLALVRRRLRQWQQPPIESSLTRNQFHHITGLDPSPIFGPEPDTVDPEEAVALESQGDAAPHPSPPLPTPTPNDAGPGDIPTTGMMETSLPAPSTDPAEG